MDPKDIKVSISSAPERISHETHVHVVPFDTRISKNTILISVDQLVLPLFHRHCLQYATRTYLYRLFVEDDLYRKVLHLPHVDLLYYLP